jgi:serine protease Do
MKRSKKVLAVLATGVLGCVVAFSGCMVGADGVNGTNGIDGKDGKDVTISDVYEAYLSETGKTKEEYTLLDFIEDHYSSNGTSSDALAEYTSLQSTMNRAMLSGMTILTTFTNTTTVTSGSFYRPQTTTLEYNTIYAGSGVIVEMNDTTSTAYVVTNCHVVYEADAKNVIADDVRLFMFGQDIEDVNFSIEYDETLYTRYGLISQSFTDDGKYAISADVVGASIAYDIALLKVTGDDYQKLSDYGAKAATWSTDDNVYVGETVFAVGSPDGEGLSVTKGIISRDSENIPLDVTDSSDSSNYRYYRVLRTDAAINGGNSGGALYNSKGLIVGIVNAKNASDSTDNVGYALPASTVRRVVAILRDNENGAITKASLNKAYIGITLDITGSTAVYSEEDGQSRMTVRETIAVADVKSGSLAEGKLQVGDIFRTIKINDGEAKVITRQYNITDYMMEAHKAGDVVTIGYTRNGVDGEVTITITSDCIQDADTYTG